MPIKHVNIKCKYYNSVIVKNVRSTFNIFKKSVTPKKRKSYIYIFIKICYSKLREATTQRRLKIAEENTVYNIPVKTEQDTVNSVPAVNTEK